MSLHQSDLEVLESSNERCQSKAPISKPTTTKPMKQERQTRKSISKERLEQKEN